MSGNNAEMSDKENSGRRVTRTNLSMTPEQLEKYKTAADELGMSLSQFVRLAAEEKIAKEEEDHIDPQFLPLLEEIEELKSSIEELKEQSVKSSVDELESSSPFQPAIDGGNPAEEYANELHGSFSLNESYSVPDLTPKTGLMEFEVQQGLRELEDMGVIRRVHPENEVRFPEWELQQ